jgi:hypothetical protein
MHGFFFLLVWWKCFGNGLAHMRWPVRFNIASSVGVFCLLFALCKALTIFLSFFVGGLKSSLPRLSRPVLLFVGFIGE